MSSSQREKVLVALFWDTAGTSLPVNTSPVSFAIKLAKAFRPVDSAAPGAEETESSGGIGEWKYSFGKAFTVTDAEDPQYAELRQLGIKVAPNPTNNISALFLDVCMWLWDVERMHGAHVTTVVVVVTSNPEAIPFVSNINSRCSALYLVASPECAASVGGPDAISGFVDLNQILGVEVDEAALTLPLCRIVEEPTEQQRGKPAAPTPMIQRSQPSSNDNSGRSVVSDAASFTNELSTGGRTSAPPRSPHVAASTSVEMPAEGGNSTSNGVPFAQTHSSPSVDVLDLNGSKRNEHAAPYGNFVLPPSKTGEMSGGDSMHLLQEQMMQKRMQQSQQSSMAGGVPSALTQLQQHAQQGAGEYGNASQQHMQQQQLLQQQRHQQQSMHPAGLNPGVALDLNNLSGEDVSLYFELKQAVESFSVGNTVAVLRRIYPQQSKTMRIPDIVGAVIPPFNSLNNGSVGFSNAKFLLQCIQWCFGLKNKRKGESIDSFKYNMNKNIAGWLLSVLQKKLEGWTLSNEIKKVAVDIVFQVLNNVCELEFSQELLDSFRVDNIRQYLSHFVTMWMESTNPTLRQRATTYALDQGYIAPQGGHPHALYSQQQQQQQQQQHPSMGGGMGSFNGRHDSPQTGGGDQARIGSLNWMQGQLQHSRQRQEPPSPQVSGANYHNQQDSMSHSNSLTQQQLVQCANNSVDIQSMLRILGGSAEKALNSSTQERLVAMVAATNGGLLSSRIPTLYMEFFGEAMDLQGQTLKGALTGSNQIEMVGRDGPGDKLFRVCAPPQQHPYQQFQVPHSHMQQQNFQQPPYELSRNAGGASIPQQLHGGNPTGQWSQQLVRGMSSDCSSSSDNHGGDGSSEKRNEAPANFGGAESNSSLFNQYLQENSATRGAPPSHNGNSNHRQAPGSASGSGRIVLGKSDDSEDYGSRVRQFNDDSANNSFYIRTAGSSSPGGSTDEYMNLHSARSAITVEGNAFGSFRSAASNNSSTNRINPSHDMSNNDLSLGTGTNSSMVGGVLAPTRPTQKSVDQQNSQSQSNWPGGKATNGDQFNVPPPPGLSGPSKVFNFGAPGEANGGHSNHSFSGMQGSNERNEIPQYPMMQGGYQHMMQPLANSNPHYEMHFDGSFGGMMGPPNLKNSQHSGHEQGIQPHFGNAAGGSDLYNQGNYEGASFGSNQCDTLVKDMEDKLNMRSSNVEGKSFMDSSFAVSNGDSNAQDSASRNQGSGSQQSSPVLGSQWPSQRPNTEPN